MENYQKETLTQILMNTLDNSERLGKILEAEDMFMLVQSLFSLKTHEEETYKRLCKEYIGVEKIPGHSEDSLIFKQYIDNFFYMVKKSSHYIEKEEELIKDVAYYMQKIIDMGDSEEDYYNIAIEFFDTFNLVY